MIQLKSFMVNCFGENCYLLYDETKEAVIVDCGTSTPAEEQKIAAFVDSQQLVLKHHLCTHVHGDHLLGAHFIFTKYGLLPEAGTEDIEQMPGIREQAQLFGLPLPPEELPYARSLRDGDRITFGQSELQVLAVPGHSPGSMAFYSPEAKLVIVGDALFAGSIGRTDFWGGDQRQLIEAIETQLMALPGETKVYPGHGPSTTVAYEKLHNPYIN